MHQGSCHCGVVRLKLLSTPQRRAKHGVNLGNFSPELIASVTVRRFDGADTWTFFDEMPAAGR